MAKSKYKLTIPIADEQTFKMLQNAHGAVNKFSKEGTPFIAFDNWVGNIVIREAYGVIQQIMEFDKQRQKAMAESVEKAAANKAAAETETELDTEVVDVSGTTERSEGEAAVEADGDDASKADS